jgi:Arc/MetJ family transcription regulator
MKKVNYRTKSSKKGDPAVVREAPSPYAEEPAEVRTNIILEEPLVMEAQAITGIKTKSGVVHYALREVVRRARQKEMLNLQGKVKWDGDLDEMRRNRF